MNENDEEAHLQRTALEMTFTPGVESWTSSSTATLAGDDGVPSSESNKNVSDQRPNVNEKDSSSSCESDLASNTFVALRPLYTSVPQPISEHGPLSASDMKLVQRSRKGHRKSRQGCFNCKRRKIKVGPTTRSWASANPVAVPRNTASMRQLHAERTGVQVSSRKSSIVTARLRRGHWQPRCSCSAANDTNLQPVGHALLPPFHLPRLPSSPSRQ